MRLLYDIFFILFSIFYIPVLLFKGKFHRDFIQRFGFLPGSVTAFDKPIWIHAVSVGEAALASKLASEIKKKFPKRSIVVSTTTRTGNEMALKRGKGTIDAVFYYRNKVIFSPILEAITITTFPLSLSFSIQLRLILSFAK